VTPHIAFVAAAYAAAALILTGMLAHAVLARRRARREVAMLEARRAK
jgi:heme exporter protein CcmD